jgi:hypothetical protein
VDNAGSQNLLIEIGTSFPVSPSLNELFFNGSMGGVFRWNGLTWNGVGDIHTVPTKNIIFNSAFAVWQRGTSSTNCPAGSVTYLADRWFVLPSGASVTQEQSTSVSSPRSTYSLRVNGAASVTSCVVAQRLEAIDTPQETMTIQARIYNDTGAPITPDLVVDTPSATDDWTTSTNRLTQALQACPDASWTQVYYTFTTSGMTDIANGVQIGIDFGALTTGYVLVTQVQVERGASLTTYRAPPIGDELMRCQRYFERIGPFAIDAALAFGMMFSATSFYGTTWFKQTKRITPGITIVNGLSSIVWRAGLASSGVSAVLSYKITTQNTVTNVTLTTAGTAGHASLWSSGAAGNTYLDVDAEL